ncbi:sugar transferase [Pontixanthobacter gangjinensis]|uniref:Sugar transferase n=1 Tax=Pontixanthobacter gangjinensis TaxID=1028742 RepID=A0A6I4SKJ1_9SPHN|nr:sugar transferase [Pontixanthobacter gangjinensis]MXO55650.1 sugar transferase [Pontixanthobacter gangjinensis]
MAKLRRYAKARRLSYVLPVNFLTFAGASSVIFVIRVPYSVSLIGSCFIATLVTSYVLTALTRLGSRTQYIVAGGRVSELSTRPNQIMIDSLELLEAKVDNGDMEGSLVGDLHFDHEDEWERLFAKAALRGIPVYHYRQIMELETGQVRIDRLSENVLGSLIPNLPYMALKRAIDVVSVILLAPALLMLMAIIALVVRLDSKGPVLFIQERMGFRGEAFRMVKFRTMHVRDIGDDEESIRQDSMTKAEDDRITRVGRFLRKVRIDELPQAWNILKGDMSWIGPRPEAISLSEWYEGEIPFYSYRHIVRPGLTGWAQVNQGHVTGINDVNAKLRYDFYYVKNISHWLDMLIALKTIRVVLGGFGAK